MRFVRPYFHASCLFATLTVTLAVVGVAGCAERSAGDDVSVRAPLGIEVNVNDNGFALKAPFVDVKVNNDGVGVKAPGVDVRVDDDGVGVKAPGVDVNTSAKGVTVDAPLGVSVKTTSAAEPTKTN